MTRGKGAKVKREDVKWTAGSLTQKKTKERTNEGLIVSIYIKIPSNKDMFLDLQWAVHDVCDVDRRDFRGGVRLWRRPTCLGRSAGLRPYGLGCDEEGLDCVGIGVRADEERLEARRVDEERKEGGAMAGQCRAHRGRHVVGRAHGATARAARAYFYIDTIRTD